MTNAARDKLIVALDVGTAERALELVVQLADVTGMFKIGSRLFTAAGPSLVREIVKRQSRVFLDLKFHDIPNTVATAAVEAVHLGVSMLDVHTSGGREMLRAVVEAVHDIGSKQSLARPMIVGITVLTSLDDRLTAEVGFHDPVSDLVTRLATLAAECGLDGVVASPLEVSMIKSQAGTSALKVVTPGIRSGDVARDDQTRVFTPGGAIRAGADFLVVGRPIIESAEPAAAAAEIVREIESAFLPAR